MDEHLDIFYSYKITKFATIPVTNPLTCTNNWHDSQNRHQCHRYLASYITLHNGFRTNMIIDREIIDAKERISLLLLKCICAHISSNVFDPISPQPILVPLVFFFFFFFSFCKLDLPLFSRIIFWKATPNLILLSAPFFFNFGTYWVKYGRCIEKINYIELIRPRS